ncbi:MAG: hypothetical protein Q8N63_02905 [Nanoarchaeota archaeon]|nr:hypothetical protein [Nanoarchaeota archaeon]
MNPELKEMMEKIDSSYKKIREEQNETAKRFDEEVAKLTGIVSQEFNRVLGEIDLSKVRDNVKREVKIKDFQVNYGTQFKKIRIEIKDWGVNIDGKFLSDRNTLPYSYCAYSYLKPVISNGNRDPKIKEFMKDFNVDYIHYGCNCGSDHA